MFNNVFYNSKIELLMYTRLWSISIPNLKNVLFARTMQKEMTNIRPILFARQRTIKYLKSVSDDSYCISGVSPKGY